METLEAILTRRSTRVFAEKYPEKGLIETVIEAGRFAPSGGNNQSTHLIIICRKDILSELATQVQDEFSKMEIEPDMYSSIKNSISRAKKGGYVFHYNAPYLIVVANKKGYGNAMADSACVLENMMIAANALELGSCWINQLHWLDDNTAIREYMEHLGLEKDETITGALAIGYASGTLNRTGLPRTGNPVTWVE